MDNKCVLVNERNIGFDFLKIFASFAVVMIHVIGAYWDKVEYNSLNGTVFIVYNSIVRWCVPAFVMISGALFLSANNSIEKMYKKYILRIVTAFIFWSALYATVYYTETKSIKGAIAQFVKGNYHLWFLFMIVGLYMIIPLLKKISIESKLVKYFIFLSIIFGMIVPEVITSITAISPKLGNFSKEVIEELNMYLVLGYSGYFFLGFFLSKNKLKEKYYKIIALLGIIGFISTIALTFVGSYLSHHLVEHYLKYLTLNVLLESIFIYSLFQNMNNHFFNKKTKKIIIMLSKYSFGVYLSHDLFLKILDNKFHLNSLSFNPIISIPIITILVFILSYLTSAVINQIPIFKKYIV